MRFVKESLIQASPKRVFAFHEQDNALELLLPPWESARVIQRATIAVIGSRAIIETNIIGPLKIRWVAEHTRYEPPHLFEDIQIRAPFAVASTVTSSQRSRRCTLRDEIEYEPPLPPSAD